MISHNINPLKKGLLKKSYPYPDVLTWIDELKKGNTSLLARAITLIESTNAADKLKAEKLLSKLFTLKSKSIRLGITGPPGVGKSSFIESIGLEILKDPLLKIAVLTYDPISPIQGGSILGDKTRMQNLSNHPRAFIRPSPSSLSSSINEACRSAINVCEVAGYDYILIETVGTGQSELLINHLVDYSILLLNPAGGDELQGIKRGIMEIADLIIVNKDDSGLENAAKTTQANYQNAIKLLSRARVKVMKCSSLQNKGIKEISIHLASMISQDKKAGILSKKRKNQRVFVFHEIIKQKINLRLNGILLNKKSKSILDKAKDPTGNLNELAEKFINLHFKSK
jgi:LAO/AO transport system kinase